MLELSLDWQLPLRRPVVLSKVMSLQPPLRVKGWLLVTREGQVLARAEAMVKNENFILEEKR